MSETPFTAAASDREKLGNPFSYADDDDSDDRSLPETTKPSLPARVWKAIVGFSRDVVGQLLSPQFWVNMIKNALRDALSAILYSVGGRMLKTGTETGDPQFKQQRIDPTAQQGSAYAQAPRSGPSAGFNGGFSPEPSYRGNEFLQPTPSSPRRNTPGGWN
jgi:hypothetical protein